MTRIGVFGSAFNPPHIGHPVLVAEARWQLGLDRVIVVPTGDPWHKKSDALPDPPTRLALADAAFGEQEGVETSDLEVRRAGPSYTCDTLEEIAALHPDHELVLLLGADAALGFGSWRSPELVSGLARIAVASRGSIDRDRIERVIGAAAGGTLPEFFTMPEIGVSSTLVRERILAGTPYRHLVPTPVAQMIDNERLYAG